MKKRIFIAINLPENIKKIILSWQEKYSRLNVHWTKMDNMHITLAFIGYAEDATLEKIIDVMSGVAGHFAPFEIKLTKIVLGPSPANPRMLWIEIEPNETLRQLNLWVDNALVDNRIPYEDTHNFRPHITIARANASNLINKKISGNLDLNFMAESIDIMESRLFKNGAEYNILKRIRF